MIEQKPPETQNTDKQQADQVIDQRLRESMSGSIRQVMEEHGLQPASNEMPEQTDEFTRREQRSARRVGHLSMTGANTGRPTKPSNPLRTRRSALNKKR